MAGNMLDLNMQLQNLNLQQKVKTLDALGPHCCLDLAAQHGGGEDSLVAVSSSAFNIHLYRRASLAQTHILKGHDDLISAMGFLHGEPQLLFSASEDKTVRIWDPRTSVKKAVQQFSGEGNTRGLSLLSCDVSQSDRVLCAGTAKLDQSDAYLLFWDRRKDRLLGCYEDSHNDDVTQVRFHPVSEKRLLSGSMDGLVNVYDISQTSEDDALVSTFNTEATVERAGWCGVGGRQVFCSTHMFTWHTWDTETEEDLVIIRDFAEKLEGKCKAEYLAGCFPVGTVTTNGDLTLLVGSHSGDLHLVDVSDPEDIKVTRSLPAAHTDTVRCSHWDSQTQTLVTGGEDSLLCLWSLSAEKGDNLTVARKGKTKGKKVSAREKSAPYTLHKSKGTA